MKNLSWATIQIALLAIVLASCGAPQVALLNQGMAHNSAGQYSEALSVLNQAADTPGNLLPWVYLVRSQTYTKLDRHELALADIDDYRARVTEHDDVSHGHLARGNILLTMGRLAEAESEFEQVLALQPSKWQAGALKSLDALDEIARSAAGRGWLGAVLRPTVTEQPGILVNLVVPGGPAEKAGMQNGDLILAWNGKAFGEPLEFARQVASTAPGTMAELDLLRRGVKLRVKLAIEEHPFRKEERRYLAAPVKPPLPEAARRFRIQAEQAVERKRFAEAADRYLDALQLAPWWAEGRFNRALILAELDRHAQAVREMKRYLFLAPDAADARAAQDQIYRWEALMK